MRRPTFCHNSVGAVESEAPARSLEKEETRLSRMKRIFTGSLLMGRRPPCAVKTFAVCLEELPITNEGLPRVVVRITTFIEKYGLQMEGLFRLSGGNPKLVERLKLSFDRTGDADLESCGDITSVASLLKVWLRDLPEPVVSASATAELISLLHKYNGDPEWCTEARLVLANGLKERNARLLHCILRLLYRYQLCQTELRTATVQSLACVFSPLLLCADESLPNISTPDTTAATSSLISHYPIIYREPVSDHIISGPNSPELHLFPANNKKSTVLITETTTSSAGKKQRKRKDRQDRSDLLSGDRKFVRSNSEERPCKSGSVEPGGCSGSSAKDSIRRVSSHEDFSRSRSHMASRHSAHLMELISETASNIETSTAVAQPLQERNSSVVFVRSANKLRTCNSTSSQNNININNSNNNNNNNNNNSNSANNNNNIANDNGVVGNFKLVLEQAGHVVLDDSLSPTVVCMPPERSGNGGGGGYTSELFDENEHERRRNSERFAPHQMGVRTTTRRRKMPSRSHKKHQPSSVHTAHQHKQSVEDMDGGSSSKENEEDSSQPVHMTTSQCRSPMVVSPPPMPPQSVSPLPTPPTSGLIQQASFSGDESPETPGSLSHSSSGSCSPSFLHLHSQLDDRARSPSPSRNIRDDGAGSDHEDLTSLDLSTLHQNVDSSEPLPSRDDWSFAQQQPQPPLPQFQERQCDVSPRSSATFAAGHRAFAAAQAAVASTDEPMVLSASSHTGAVTALEQHAAMDLTKQIQTIKKRLKKYEEGFEREFGYRPSHADKMANPDTKKMCSLLSKLRKELKQLKTEGVTGSTITRLLHLPSADKVAVNGANSSGSPTKVIKEDVIHDVERRLSEKRSAANRPDNVDEMSHDQLVEEKASIQRALLQLESNYGRPTSKEERDIVRPLYDRYRSLKRLLVRSATSKLKDSVSELGTILEHEQMDFSSSSPPPPSTAPIQPLEPSNSSSPVAASKVNGNTIAGAGAAVSAPLRTSAGAAASVVPRADETSGRPTTPDMFENLHALPRSELLEQQKQTREEKKKMRRQLREFEEEFENRTGRKLQREDRSTNCMQLYSEYKHIKAKLRLLEALLAKK